jgi:hypothetical protein
MDQDNAVADQDRDAGADGHDEEPRSAPGNALIVVNGVIAAVGGTYAATHSLAATIVAGCAGLACAVILSRKQKR